MKLNEIHIQELDAGIKPALHQFIFPKWDGHEIDDVLVEPFDVLVKYRAEHLAEEDSIDIEIASITANEPVHLTSDNGLDISKLKEMENLHAIVVGGGKKALAKVQGIFDDVAVLDAQRIEKGTKGALQIFSYFDDHRSDDVIISASGSELLTDIHCVVLLKALLDGPVSYKTAGMDREFEFTGRIIILTNDLASVDDALEHRCAIIDLSKDRTFPKGTSLQDIPGWSEQDAEFFRKQALRDFSGRDE